MQKLHIPIECYECDSEYTIQYYPGSITNEIKYCIICSEPLETVQEEEQED